MSNTFQLGSRVFCFCALFWGYSIICFGVEPSIKVPIRFHIVTGLTIEKNGLVMSNWLTTKDVRNIILPEVNRIWQPAGIEFHAENVLVSKSLNPPDRQALVDSIAQAHRDSMGKSDPKRIKKLNKLIDWSKHIPNLIHVYYVPYLGETSQGNAKRKHSRVFVGQWSDKASKARGNPKKFQLVEASPFKKGSISRTTGHELGHILGLKHPNKKYQTVFGRLMGGRKAGYKLTSNEIAMARKRAVQVISKDPQP